MLSDKVANSASIIAKDKNIRKIVHHFQQRCAYNPPKKYAGSILDGRDITSVQVKDAMFKFYITASLKVRAKRRYNEYKKLTFDFHSLSSDFKDLQADRSNNIKILSENKLAIEALQGQQTELQRLLDINRHDIDEQERIEREREELQEELERLQEYRGKEDSIYTGVTLNECNEIVIYLFNSYRDFIYQHESEYPDLTDGDKIFLMPDFYDTTDYAAGDAKNNARKDWSDSVLSSFEDYIVNEIGIPFNVLIDHDDDRLSLLSFLMAILSFRRIQTITEDLTNIPDDIIFEDIFDPDLFSIIHFSQDDIETNKIYTSIDDPNVKLTASECIFGDESLRCIV